MSALELQVYELFKKRFSEEEAKTVIQYFESKAEEKTQQKKDLFLTKDDKVDLIDRINKSKVETIVFLSAVTSRMKYNSKIYFRK